MRIPFGGRTLRAVMFVGMGGALIFTCALSATDAVAQSLPAWKIADICTGPRDSAPGYCASGETTAQRAVSGSWAFIPDAIRQSCLASFKTPADQSWRVLGDCIEAASNRSIDATAVKTARTPGEPVPPPRAAMTAPVQPPPVAIAAPPPPAPIVVVAPPPAALPPPVAGVPTAPPPLFDRLARDADAARKLADAADARKAAEATEARRKADADAMARKTAEDLAAAQRAKAMADAKICSDDIRKFAKDGTIRFATGSARLDPASTPTLSGIVEVAKQCPNVVLQVEGHTDSIGDPQANKALSQARAEAIVAFMVAAGLPPARLKASGFGDTKPVAANDSQANRALNRRIEFSVGGG